MRSRISWCSPCLAVVLVALSCAPALARQSDFDIGFAPGRPGTKATLTLHIVYRNPADPSGKPSPIRHIAIVLPRGTTLDVGGVPACEATNSELQLQGPSACPTASRIGTGTLTAITGFGAPIDPFIGSVTIFNDGHGWVEVVQERQTGATIAVDRFKLTGRTLIGNPPATPGGPPDGQTAVRTIDFTFPAARRFVTTPPSCPPSASWRSTASFTFADGTTQDVASRAPCSDTPSGSAAMRLTASPAEVETGWRRITFAVASSAARCLRGATVAFAGHEATTGPKGRTSVRAHLGRAGVYRASARKAGCRRATADVVVTRDDDD